LAIETQQSAEAEARDAVLWCNFCGYKTTDQSEYLNHSCKDILEAKGIDTAPTETKECR
jgi:hypothetical protein